MARWFPDAMPRPMADAESLPWWQAAAEHRLVVQRCGDCGRDRHPPAPVCARCRSDRAEWREVSGRGVVYTYTVVHRPVAPEQQVPFAIVVVELDGTDGVRLISNLVEADPAAARVGLRVELVWEDVGPELALPRFRPVISLE